MIFPLIAMPYLIFFFSYVIKAELSEKKKLMLLLSYYRLLCRYFDGEITISCWKMFIFNLGDGSEKFSAILNFPRVGQAGTAEIATIFTKENVP